MTEVADPPVANQAAAIITAILITVSSAFPFFLTGALGTEVRDNLNMSETTYGVVTASFFIGAALGSIVLGRIGESIGPRRLTLRTLSVTIVAELAIALFVTNGPQLGAILFVAGVANSGAQTAVNRLLGDTIRRARLGTAISMKQSGMPAASMIGGLAVPIVALQFGWRWSYGVGVVMAVAAFIGVITIVEPQPNDASGAVASRRRPNTPHRILLIAAAAAAFASFGAGATNSWLTSSAVEAGWSSGTAGLMLSFCAASGITLRLTLGVLADRDPARLPFPQASAVLVIGALGALVLGVGSFSSQLIGGLLAAGIGWSWPAVFNIGVVRANPDAPGAATGVTQTGVYVGVLTSPMVVAALVHTTSYRVAWSVTAGSMLIGAALMAWVARLVVSPGADIGHPGSDANVPKIG